MAAAAKEPPQSPATKPYQDAMERLAAGELGPAVKGMLRIHEQYTETEEAWFVEEQLARVRRLWPAEAEKAGLTSEAWAALQERAAKRKAAAKLPAGGAAVVALLFVIGTWALVVAAAPGVAFLGRIEVPYIFRLVAGIAGAVAVADAFGLLKLKWEAVNVFIVLSPVFMIVTFIGLVESGDMLGRVVCGAALAAQAVAAWYMSKQSHHFIY